MNEDVKEMSKWIVGTVVAFVIAVVALVHFSSVSIGKQQQKDIDWPIINNLDTSLKACVIQVSDRDSQITILNNDRLSLDGLNKTLVVQNKNLESENVDLRGRLNAKSPEENAEYAAKYLNLQEYTAKRIERETGR